MITDVRRHDFPGVPRLVTPMVGSIIGYDYEKKIHFKAKIIGLDQEYFKIEVIEKNHPGSPSVGEIREYRIESAHNYCLLDSAPTVKVSAPIGRQEKPCIVPTCKRMNDIGVKQCWHCETPQ